MKKILYVITKSNWGGAQRYVFDLATSLPPEFEVSVAYGQPGLLAQRLQGAGITVHPIKSLQRDISAWADIKSFFELYWLFIQEAPDVVHLNSSKAGGVGALAAWFAGIKHVVFTVHGWPFGEQRNFLARIALRLASHLTGILSDTVICICDHDLLQVRWMPGVHAVRIYNGIGPMELGSGSAIRAAFPPGALIVGTIGELNKNKNHIALIEETRLKPRFVAIVGEGELRSMLEAKIKEYHLEDRVKLFGFMPAFEVLRGFDVFALPSLKEGLPYVLLEAKQAGLPIEASRVGGIPEIVDAKDMSGFTLDKMVQKTVEAYRS